MEDYKTSKRFSSDSLEDITLPKSNVIKFIMEDGYWFTLRPSGTEPKVKVYFTVKGISLEDSKMKLDSLQTEVM